MRRFRKFKPESWRNFLHKLDVDIDLNICKGYVIPSRWFSILYFKSKAIIIINSSGNDDHVFSSPICIMGDIALFLRKYRFSRKVYRLFEHEKGVWVSDISRIEFERLKNNKL